MTRLVEASERIEGMAARVSPRVGADFYLLDELLTDEERAFRDKARAFCEREVIPVAAEYWDRAEFPFALIPKLAETGIVGGAIHEADVS